ncbi:MAG: hypothetical protein WCC99_14340 [Candidatus Sulfotelmatobacter sp.]
MRRTMLDEKEGWGAVLKLSWVTRSWNPKSVFSRNVSRILGPRAPDAPGKPAGTSVPWLIQQGRSRQGTLSGGNSTAIGRARAV